MGGTGVGLAFAERAAREAGDGGLRIEVLPSLGTTGGIKALATGAIDVAISARVPTGEERAKGLREGACMTTALALATSRPQAPGIDLDQLPEIYRDPSPLWPDGQPLKIILRSPAGSENAYLAKLVPEMESAIAAAYKRPGIPVGATDQENVELLRRAAGSFGIATLLQVKAENLPLTLLPVNGIAPSTASLADRSYPLPLTVCFLVAAESAAGAAAFIAFLRSAPGRDLARAFGAEPTE